MLFDRLIALAQRKNLVPKMSPTERQALDAGTVWLDGELFAGKPDLERMLAEPYPALSERERAFLDGPVDTVCRMVDDWELARSRELPGEVWDYLRAQGFFGLAIPTEHGGLGFSALAQSAVFGKLASRSLPLSAVVLIPNSVGPGELLLEYGTPEQREHYLPRLARGEEIPCFALTEPGAGSDAANLTSKGVVFRGEDGEPWIRLDWEKRYITLAPVATLLGLAFVLEDPEELLGRGRTPGITLALIPTDLPGVEVGRRHDPMGVPFPNGPTRGRGVEVPVSTVIGGAEYAGRGWRMLMEALSAGRSISLPAQGAAGGKKMARVSGAYAAVRRQFGVPVGKFEGVEEPLARIGGTAYLMEAARVLTCGGVDAGHRSAVLSGVVKVHQTELARAAVLDAMDILGGTAIFRGPRNPLGDAYPAAPIGITVEGANILTRSLIIFGQGAIRCHPYARRELDALEAEDPRALRRAVLGHIGYSLRTAGRAAWRWLTRGRLVRVPVDGPAAAYLRRLSWASTRFALLTELALVALGSRLKMKEKLSGRFADTLSWMYLGFAALRRFEAEGRREEDEAFMRWAAEESLHRVQTALEGIARNFPAGVGVRSLGRLALRLAPLGHGPSDRLGGEVARRLQEPGEQRDRLTAGIFVPEETGEALGRLEEAFRLSVETGEAEARVRRAVRRGELPRLPERELPAAAAAAGVLEEGEAEALERAVRTRREALAVDEYSPEEYRGLGGVPETTEHAPQPVG